MQPRILIITLLASLGLVVSSRAEDWPQWRGAQRDGVWRETGIVERIPAAGLAVRWSAKVGNGYSAPSVANGRVFLTDHVFDPELERVLCFDAATGKQLWMHSYAVDYKNMEYGNGPRAAPTVHGGNVFTLGTQGHLFCLDATSGTVVWQKNLVQDFRATMPTYGAAAAPLVVGDVLIVMAGGKPEACVVALDCPTGAVRWQALADRASYSAPIAINAGGCEQAIVWAADSITSFDPPSGKQHWQLEWRANFDPAQRVATPVRHGDTLLFMGAWSRGSKLLRLDPAKPAAAVLWETRKDPSTMHSTPLFQEDGHFYAIQNDGSLACLNSATGDKVWSTFEPTSQRMGNAHLVRHEDRVFIFNHTGHLILARLSPTGYEERGRCLLVEPTAGYRAQGALTWAHPAFANQCVFARNDRELVCASLAADANAAIAAAQPRVKSHVAAGSPTGGATLAFSPDGKTLALGGNWAQSVKIIDLASGTSLPAPPPLRDFLCAVAFSPDGRMLVAAGGSEFTPARNGGKTTGQIKVFDVRASQETGELIGHTNKVFAVAFSPDSQLIATGAADNTARLWDAVALKERRVLSGHHGAILAVAFAPDGKTVATASADHTVRLWDATTGDQRCELTASKEEVRAVAFSPDGKFVAAAGADNTVRLWDAATQQERAVLRGHRGSINGLAFSPDGQTLASGSSDETIKLWSIAAVRERVTLRGHRSAVTAVAYAPDAQTLASAGLDDPARLWPLSSEMK
jgi:outer membrane protein assembly factor BamB